MIKLFAKHDLILLVIVLTLTCFGLVMVYSSSAVMAERTTTVFTFSSAKELLQ